MRLHLRLFIVVLAMAGPACGKDGGTGDADAADVASVDATMQAASDALAAGDVDGFMELWTDNGLQRVPIGRRGTRV